MDKWDARFFDLCALVASWSEDRSRKVGAVIVGHSNEIRSLGFNGLPRGVNGNISQRHSRVENEKYHWFEHGERNAIFNAARAGISLEGCRLYTSLFPCADCTRAVIQCGIIQINTFPTPENDRRFDRSFEVAIEMCSEAKVEIRIFEPRPIT
ncbi:MAG: deoxycytidylate deaminase [Methylocella sp.]